jgi:uncharacterized protein
MLTWYRLQRWQWVTIVTPVAIVVAFLLVAAGWQIHTWGINWVWAIFVVVLAVWRWLLVRWTKVDDRPVEVSLEGVDADPELIAAAKEVLAGVIAASREDPPIWEDLNRFGSRCRETIEGIAKIVHPQEKYPFLNIYVTRAYRLMQDTLADFDRAMVKLAPTLDRVTIANAYQTYEAYQKLAPAAQKLWKAWNWAQWLLNPAIAVAKTATQKSTKDANRELVGNLSQVLTENLLTNLARRALELYSGRSSDSWELASPQAIREIDDRRQSIRELIAGEEKIATVEKADINILLLGRTGAGKSSLINTLFASSLTSVDLLPNTANWQSYRWQAGDGESLNIWDVPGYEQIDRPEFTTEIVQKSSQIDLILAILPALDAALETDLQILSQIHKLAPNIPTIGIISQVDRLRPFQEWQPPYNWQTGDRPKEITIRAAVEYRAEKLKNHITHFIPIVNNIPEISRSAWGIEPLIDAMVTTIVPAKQARMVRFFNNIDYLAATAAKIVDRYALQMTTTQGLAAFLKSPVLQYLSTMTTGTPTLAYILSDRLPVEQLPVVIGKLQMAVELHRLLKPQAKPFDIDFRRLWTIAIDCRDNPAEEARTFGNTLIQEWLTD